MKTEKKDNWNFNKLTT